LSRAEIAGRSQNLLWPSRGIDRSLKALDVHRSRPLPQRLSAGLSRRLISIRATDGVDAVDVAVRQDRD